jgi:hypothetical protein
MRLIMPTRFLRRAIPAVALTLLVLPACGDPASPGPTFTFKFLVNSMTAGQDNTTARALAIDLDGDGAVDNQFGQIVGALETQGLTLNGVLAGGIADGSMEHLIRVTSHDTTLTTDGDATAQFYVAGSGGAFPGPYAPAAGIPPATFTGSISAGAFASPNPMTTTTPVSLSVRLILFGGTPVVVPIEGASLRFAAGLTTSPQLINGRINGALTMETVNNFIFPALAEGLNATIQQDPTSQTAQTILALFDTGGCSSGTAGDQMISICEVATNSLMASLFAPDVQLLPNGTFAPKGAGGSGALSVAFGFTAQLTTF